MQRGRSIKGGGVVDGELGMMGWEPARETARQVS